MVEAEETAGDVLKRQCCTCSIEKDTYSEDDLGILKLTKDVHRVECPKNLFGCSRTCRLSQLGILNFTGFRDE